MKDYAAIATQYARDVVDGRILACKWVRLACQRHLDDLAREGADWRYLWNPEIATPAVTDESGRITKEARTYRPADRACHFIELLPHIKDDWRQSAARGARLVLEPWQIFFVASIFGWVDRNDWRRRFRTADLIVPRKNAKSTVAAAIGLYMGFVEGEVGAEVYSGATSEKQAGEVFKPAKLMAEREPEFRARFGVTVLSSNISCAATNSRFERVIGKPGDGASPSCAIVDEYHEHANEDLYDTMRTGMLARAQPLMLVITTAGDDVSGPCYAHQEELQQVLQGLVEDDRRFGIIYTIDEGDDWTSEEALIKANPNLGVSIDPETLLADQRDAVRDPRKQATFQTKHLDLWVSSASPWLPMQAWKAAADKTLRIEAFTGEPCWEGVDLANTTDIASRAKIFKRPMPTDILYTPEALIATVEQRREYEKALLTGAPLAGWAWRKEDRDHYYCFWRNYLPEARIDEPENKHYQGWHKTGWLIATAGNMIDQDRIEDDILAENKIYPLRRAAFDPWGAPGIIAALQNELGNDNNNEPRVCTVPLQARYLSAPMKWIDGLLRDGRLHHNGDPVAAWAVNNVTCKPDKNDNWFPRKPAAKGRKTDPGVALIVGMSQAMSAEPQAEQYQVMVV